mgnify:FL=1
MSYQEMLDEFVRLSRQGFHIAYWEDGSRELWIEGVCEAFVNPEEEEWDDERLAEYTEHERSMGRA